MRDRLSFFLGFLSFATIAFGNDRFVLISGTVNNFHTDARLFNPAFDKDIDVTATFLQVGNVDNSAATSTTIHVPKRQMKILDDVVGAVFAKTGLGAIKFSSTDEFEITSRIYAQVAAGTLGQFGPGLPPSAAKSRGALIQLKSSNSFRTNLGAVNPNSTPATITWTLYDRNNAVINSGQTTMPPLAVIGPTNITSGTFFNAGSADLSDAWVSYSTATATPVLVYASVIDNGTTDQTFIPAVDDKGVPPPAPNGKSFDVTIRSFNIGIAGGSLGALKVGDQVTFHIRVAEGAHGFTLTGPDGETLIAALQPTPGGPAVDRTFTVDSEGTYTYFCTNSGCGVGHGNMSGTFTVGQSSNDPGPGY